MFSKQINMLPNPTLVWMARTNQNMKRKNAFCCLENQDASTKNINTTILLALILMTQNIILRVFSV